MATGIKHTTGICEVDGCNKKHYAHNMCQMHYARFNKYGNTSIVGSIKGIKRSEITKQKLRDIVRTKEWNNRISISKAGKKQNNPYVRSEEQKIRIRGLRKGVIPWNKGVKRTDIIGENNPNWTGGSKINKAIRNCFEYKAWRIEIFQRDNYTCKLCGKHGGLLNVDHYPTTFAQIIKENDIQSMDDALNCDELWDTDKNRTLCIDCHKKTPTYMKRSLKNDK